MAKNAGDGLGVNLPTLLRYYIDVLTLDFEAVSQNKRLYHRLYMRLYRFLKSLEREGAVFLFKVDGLLWVKPTVDLIKVILVKFKQTVKLGKRKRGRRRKRGRPVFKHPLRFEAAGLLMRRRRLEPGDWELLYELFMGYIDDVGGRVIVLYNERLNRFKFLRYTHRFLKHQLKEKLRAYDRAWDNASKRHNVGVFLTLTMDPSRYPNLFEASQSISEALNRLLSFLARRLGRRPEYIAVFEPQNSGNPHLHVVIFGVGRIEDHFRLTKILVGHGFGYVHWEYKIVKKGSSWVWANRRFKPKNCRTLDVRVYLRKYLSKTFSSVKKAGSESWKQKLDLSIFKLAFYFASNKRFFTCSRAFMVKRVRVPSLGWVYIGSFYWLEVPDFILLYARVTLVPLDNEFVWRLEALDG